MEQRFSTKASIKLLYLHFYSAVSVYLLRWWQKQAGFFFYCSRAIHTKVKYKYKNRTKHLPTWLPLPPLLRSACWSLLLLQHFYGCWMSVCVWCLYPRASRPHHSLLCTQLLQKKLHCSFVWNRTVFPISSMKINGFSVRRSLVVAVRPFKEGPHTVYIKFLVVCAHTHTHTTQVQSNQKVCILFVMLPLIRPRYRHFHHHHNSILNSIKGLSPRLCWRASNTN